MIVAVATDDMAVTSKRTVDIKHFKSEIKKHWDITDHGPIKWFLDFKIRKNQESRTLSIHQHVYFKSMIEKFKLTNAKRVAIPMDPHIQYSVKQCLSTLAQIEQMRGIPYAEAIGSILWPTIMSQLDTAYAVGILSQFMQNPGPVH
jgi:Reverse transcriptase (RNA-dependent DNA polymerase)